MLFKGVFNTMVVAEVAEVAKMDKQILCITHRSGAKTTTAYPTPHERDADFDKMTKLLSEMHEPQSPGMGIIGEPSGVQGPRV